MNYSHFTLPELKKIFRSNFGANPKKRRDYRKSSLN